jgi:hypothetical protein
MQIVDQHLQYIFENNLLPKLLKIILWSGTVSTTERHSVFTVLFAIAPYSRVNAQFTPYHVVYF